MQKTVSTSGRKADLPSNPETQADAVRRIVLSYDSKPGALLSVLEELQNRDPYKYLS